MEMCVPKTGDMSVLFHLLREKQNKQTKKQTQKN